MTNSQRQSKARHSFLQWVSENPTSPDHSAERNESKKTPTIVREGMVIREDFFLGRRFVTETCDAIWFIEEDQLKIFDTSGTVLQVMDRDEIDFRADQYEKSLAEDVDAGVSEQVTTIKIEQQSTSSDPGEDENRQAA